MMGELITLPFEFNTKEYCALMRIKEISERNSEIIVTIMNGELEAQLYGSHKFRIETGKIEAPSRIDEPASLVELRDQILKAISKHFSIDSSIT